MPHPSEQPKTGELADDGHDRPLFTEDDVEAAARALCGRNYHSETHWEDYTEEARAAVAAVAPGLVARATEPLQTVIAVRYERMERLMAMNDDLRARLAAAQALADEWCSSKTSGAAYHGERLHAALSSADPATCTSCGLPMDSPPCQRDPITGRGGHLSVDPAAADPASHEWLGMNR